MENQEDFWSFLTKSPFFYPALILLAVILIITAFCTYKLVKEGLSGRMTAMNIMVQKMDKRMRMQEPNFNTIYNMAKKMNVSTADMDGERSVLMDLLTAQEKMQQKEREKISGKSGKSKKKSGVKKNKKSVKDLVKSLVESPTQLETRA